MPFIGHYLTLIITIYITLSLVSLTKTQQTIDSKDSKPEKKVCDQLNSNCHELNDNCIECKVNYSCVYGQQLDLNCRPIEGIACIGETNITRRHLCAFCYQLPQHLYNCSPNSSCDYNSRYKARCEVNDPKIVCLGNRVFHKYKDCHFVSGYKWSTALLLSITLGGFGIDRFYLGLWQEGVGKLFSFGGLGVWTLIDVILIATGYLKPSDGSVYI
ncbi:unnamed protein product [Medioppia subpectinata]|uniref:TM2 domain-containing protein n=1 Tax=Medioppia subpectinata TaxID=1979941 RepID=A0A7R9L1N7_9ACAR|nr:unnamed protein product [Medioppia subpectinata]CAG2112682.1 unnamed protein product [Medioppia subpectinata]